MWNLQPGFVVCQMYCTEGNGFAIFACRRKVDRKWTRYGHIHVGHHVFAAVGAVYPADAVRRQWFTRMAPRRTTQRHLIYHSARSIASFRTKCMPRAACTLLITRDIEVVRQGIGLRIERPVSGIKYFHHLPLGSSRQNTFDTVQLYTLQEFLLLPSRLPWNPSQCRVSVFTAVGLEYFE
jgi:hypothetical protein